MPVHGVAVHDRRDRADRADRHLRDGRRHSPLGRSTLTAISPRKTVGGRGRAVSPATAVAGALLALWPLVHIAWWQGALIGAITSVAAQAGDLVESALKRDARVKDAGTAFRGHGGWLDRFDSYIFGGVAFYCALWYGAATPAGAPDRDEARRRSSVRPGRSGRRRSTSSRATPTVSGRRARGRDAHRPNSTSRRAVSPPRSWPVRESDGERELRAMLDRQIRVAAGARGTAWPQPTSAAPIWSSPRPTGWSPSTRSSPRSSAASTIARRQQRTRRRRRRAAVARGAPRRRASVLPVDSEHSALFQCLVGERAERDRGLVLTASGGPFWELDGATRCARSRSPTRSGIRPGRWARRTPSTRRR